MFMHRSSVVAVFPVLGAVFLTACATPDSPTEIYDPFEAQNRRVHAFNKVVDQALLDPTATAYGTVIPAPARRGFSNFANNLDTPRFVLNDILQGNADDAMHNTWRFLVNTTFGLGGLFDVASEAGLERRETGFGETLHFWGAEEGAYIELPVLGPSTQRGSVGTFVDFVSNPLSAAIPEAENWVFTAATITDGLNLRYQLDSTFASIYESADSYAQARSLYLQNRRFALGEKEDDFFFDPYEEFDEE